MHRRHTLCKLWYQKRPRTCQAHIQCRQWILFWWRRIRVSKRFHWRLHLYKNALLCMFEVYHSNCRNQVAPHCMLSNVRLCFQSQLGIQDTWCCRAGLGTTRCHNLDTIHCGWNQRFGSFYRPHSYCIRLDWSNQLLRNIVHVGIQCRNCWRRRQFESSKILLGTLLCVSNKRSV